jgi:hypothetical protein
MSILTIELKRAEKHQNGLSRRHRVAGGFLVWKKNDCAGVFGFAWAQISYSNSALEAASIGRALASLAC